MSMEHHQRIIFAADFPSVREAAEFVSKHELWEHVGFVKVGLELFMSSGPLAVQAFTSPVMLDLKLHDIPETVERAILTVRDLGAKFLTVHIQQRETLRRAVKAAEKAGVQLLGITVLTSMTDADLKDLSPVDDGGMLPAIGRVAVHRARLGWDEGLTGFVCSPNEVGDIRKALGPKATLVVPGIRPKGSEAGDQARIGTPKTAIVHGADYLVVGRPIRDAADPVAACKAIAREIDLGMDSGA